MAGAEKADQIIERDLTLPEVEISYTVPRNWGGFYVSEAADQAYGLVPLATVNVGRGIHTADAIAQVDVIEEPRFDILLLSPEETAAALPPELATETSSMGLRLLTQIHENGIGVALGFGGDRSAIIDSMVENALAGLQDEYEVEPIVETDVVMPESGASIREGISVELYSQFMASAFEQMLHLGAGASSQNWHRQKEYQLLWRRLNGIGIRTLGSAAILGIAGAAFYTFESPEGALISLPAMLTAVGAQLWLGRKQIKTYLSGSSGREMTFRREASSRIEAVADDIHHIYSADAFNRRFGEQSPDQL